MLIFCKYFIIKRSPPRPVMVSSDIPVSSIFFLPHFIISAILFLTSWVFNECYLILYTIRRFCYKTGKTA
jgi:hypothetical protein